MRSRLYFIVMLGFCLGLKGQDMEAGLAYYASQFVREGPYPDVSHLDMGVRVALGVKGIGNHDQYTFSFAPLRSTNFTTYGFVGGGYTVGVASSTGSWFASLGSEVRVERIRAAAFRNIPATETQTHVRPWVLGSVGWKGLVVPLPRFEIVKDQGTKRIYPFTRLEVAYPLLRADGNGFSGMLSRTTNAPQIAIHLGVHF